MYSSYSAAAFALRSARPSYNNAHSSSSYLPSHHCQQQYDADGGQRDLVPLNPHLSPRFLLDGNLLRHSTHLLLLSARLQPPPPPHPPHCCHRRAAARCCCCSGGGARSYPQHVPWRSEASAPRCCGQRTVRSDLGVVCRRFKARGCGCGSSGSATLCLGTGCGNRGAPRLLARAVRQEVWEYDGGEWPHRRCSMECHDDWDDEDQCDLAEWELPGRSRFRRRMSKEEEDDERCRDCRRRKKGVENHYYDEGEYSGRRREIGDVSGSLRSARGRLEQRGYLDDEDMRRRREMPEERDRREFDFDDARRVGARRYNEDDRKYDRRRERRDSEYDDVFDAGRLRAGRYTEDDRKFDRRTERRDFEIDNEDDVRRDGRRHRNDNELFEIRNTGRKKYREEEDVSSLGSRRWHDNESYNDDQYIAERKDYSRGRSQSSASAFHKDDSQRVSSSRNNVDTSLARENTSLRVRWDDNVDRRAAHTSEERDRRYSSYVGLSNDEKDEYDHEIERLVRVRDSRTGTKDVKVITEDDTSLNSSSKNSSILKQHRDVDQQVAARNESKRISQRIMETSEVRGNNTELDSAMLRNHQEDKRNYIDNKSSSLQSSVNIANGSRRQINRHDEVEVDQQVITLTDSRKNSEKLTDIKMDSSHNVSRASHSHRNYEEVNQMDINDKSTSIENITHIVRDKKRYVNQQVIHETDIDVQNVTHVDVSTVRASDISMLRNSQNNSETRSDVNSISNTSLIDWAVQQEQTHQNKIIASDRATVAGSQSHHNTEMYGQVHSASVIGSKKEMQEQVELTKARTNNAAMTSTSESHIGTRIDDRFQPSSSVHTASTVKGQTDLTKNHASGTVVVSNSHNRTDSQARRTSAFNLVEARDSRDKSDLQITQGSSDSEISDEARTRFSESSQDSREILTRVEETGRLMKHNMALNSQQASTRRISDTEDTTSLQIESSEEASTVNLDMEQRGTILERTETTATESIPGDSSPRNSVNESVLESAARLEKSSTFHVGQFVGELQRGTSDADTTSTMKNEKSIMEGITRSSSRSRMKGPSDEIWDVQSTTSQETFKTADKEEGSSADGGANSASQTPKNETAIAKKVHKSLWSYVADIVRLGWVQRGESHESSNKSFKKSSSSNSQSPDGWLSSQGHDNDSIEKKNWSIKRNDHQLTKSHSGESESIAASKKDESLPTGTQGLQISAAGNVREVGRSKGDFVPTVSKDGVQISGEKAKQSEVGASPKGNTMGRSAEDSISTLVDVTIGQPLEDEAASSSRITAQASAEINAGKGVSTGTSSMTIEAEEAGRNDDSGSWRYGPSVAIAPYHIPQTQTMIPHEHTPSTSLESTKFPTGGPPGMEEKNVVRMAPEFMRTEGKEAEINRRKIQRNKQVLKETFEEWEEAYQHDAEQRKTDELFMREALLEAQRAADIWEVPVGAVLVHNGEIIARGCNLVEDLRDSTAHAEIVCIREASTKLKTWRLADTTLYVTLEPCAMCAGAILQARVDTVVWGAPNKLLGADGSWVRLFPGDGQTSTLDPANQNLTAGPVHPFHPKIVVRRGVLSTECSEIMQQFFQLRRKKKQRPESPPRAHLSGRHHHPIKFFTKVHHMFGAVFCL